MKITFEINDQEACSSLIDMCKKILRKAKWSDHHTDCNGNCEPCIEKFMSEV